ncbi:hypothetical protein Q5H93_21805 [Hymenobacter sp. ASUV-10]|uniref:Uncharacterized protein n=1 Tax=Hymenobacter aranciens TaxID=3063996 RepID=A0ABT9BK60_9BACT|nr:hypothetical protein [Hymenobacter sp. ASUV-10]MDO7877392.1 hypothetical protein [Hymenobacter sp. ASUV-10]
MASNSPIDFERLAVQLMPALLRKPRLVAWLQAMLHPLRQLYTRFLLEADATRRELAYNSQTILFEQALNDQFDPSARRIIIRNSDTELPVVYLNFRSEGQPEKYARFAVEGPPWLRLYSQAEYNTQLDFTVRVPVVLRTAERTTQLHARIQHFKLATRRYTLRFV